MNKQQTRRREQDQGYKIATLIEAWMLDGQGARAAAAECGATTWRSCEVRKLLRRRRRPSSPEEIVHRQLHAYLCLTVASRLATQYDHEQKRLWEPVARELQRRGEPVGRPSLSCWRATTDSETDRCSGACFWVADISGVDAGLCILRISTTRCTGARAGRYMAVGRRRPSTTAIAAASIPGDAGEAQDGGIHESQGQSNASSVLRPSAMTRHRSTEMGRYRPL
jgi:hypothetical protein